MKAFVYFVCFIVSPALYAEEVKMAFGEAIPPFSFPESDSGIEIEVIGEALAFHNHTLHPKYFPLARTPYVFKQRYVDATMTDLGHDMSLIGAFYGNSAVVYDNVFISLKSRNLKLESPSDLKGLSIISFQGASKRYPKWLKAPYEAKLVTEQNKQLTQVLMLNAGKVDVALSDRNIFQYYSSQAEILGTTIKDVTFHPFTDVNPNNYRPVFWDKKIRDDFNEGLEHLKKTGRYQAIFDKYLNTEKE
ncbi:substrate-binding periplasmic protein [Alkalimarinus alittae]|uniref:ABC transporter substrate-binding protein n=1 Tax=Alkalimarinus alittae TaxID=2961619 RepID=A0ABY6N3E4_9ALTE|nr:ABC transporter substrate-binding protein [Alkalimarinus alittae]UZE96616.1 ABC transporter substrate-binding protein [Alkalimarinus alittae]